MKPIRVLVLGGSGRIGSMLRSAWEKDLASGCNEDIEFSFQTRRLSNSRPDDLLWDVLDPPPLTVRDAGPFDCMIVLSGIVPKPAADFALNTNIGLASLRAAGDLGVGHVLLASTSAVYGNAIDVPFVETAPLNPINDYGRSKLDMEQVCQSRASAMGRGLCCLRIGNVAGADALLMNGEVLASDKSLWLDCFADGGTPVRSYIGPSSLARAIVSLLRKRWELPTALNVAAPRPVTMRALAEAAKIPVTLKTTPENGHQYITLACDALSALHDFTPAESTPQEMVRQWQDLTGGKFKSQMAYLETTNLVRDP